MATAIRQSAMTIEAALALLDAMDLVLAGAEITQTMAMEVLGCQLQQPMSEATAKLTMQTEQAIKDMAQRHAQVGAMVAQWRVLISGKG